jgi:UDP-N-acetylglucosamine 2-epimerase (non-hydrolysing)
VRSNTERPITIDMGTNVLVGSDGERIRDEAMRILRSDASRGTVPPLWDGGTAGRIADVLERELR